MTGKRSDDDVLHEFLKIFEQSIYDQKGLNDSGDGVNQVEKWLEY
jgi:hypothetical protein